MAKVNVLRLKMYYNNDLFDEHYMFACEGAKDDCFRLAEVTLVMDDNAIETKHSFLVSMVDNVGGLSAVKFEDLSAGKGLIKDLSDKTFFITLTNVGKTYLIPLLHFNMQQKKKVYIYMHGYALSLFLHCLTCSQNYVELVTNYMSNKCVALSKLQNGRKIGLSELQVILKEPNSHIMDLTWAKIACKTVHDLRQLQYAMSWLSTLGGAFSALGEQQERCAKAAGIISIEQLRIALKLGDNIIVAQCKLYYSLSLIQCGYCKLARKIVQEQYINLKKGPVVDKKTVNMCKGVWARLKYEIQRHRNVVGKLSHNVLGKYDCRPSCDVFVNE